MYSILKWYALTVGAWKRHQRWRARQALFARSKVAEIDDLLRDMKRDFNRQLYEQPPILRFDTMLCDTHTQEGNGQSKAQGSS